MYADTIGSVKIISRDPYVKPALRFNYLSTQATSANGPKPCALHA